MGHGEMHSQGAKAAVRGQSRNNQEITITYNVKMFNFNYIP